MRLERSEAQVIRCGPYSQTGWTGNQSKGAGRQCRARETVADCGWIITVVFNKAGRVRVFMILINKKSGRKTAPGLVNLFNSVIKDPDAF